MTPEEAQEKARASVLKVHESLDMLEQRAVEMVQQCEDIVERLNAMEQKLAQIEKMHADVQRKLK
ncbi:hypothetical protein QWO17_004577 [Escherichia coli]|nr:hypothetical protein [Escherichia coli]